jgi:ADP-heptose:LPS heptosyltransferase
VLRALPGIGDLLVAVPALRALRASRPDARITLVGLPKAQWFVERFGAYVDDLLVLPGWPGLPEAQAPPDVVLRFLAEAHERRFDVALQLHGSGVTTNALTCMLGAPHVAGFHLPAVAHPGRGRFFPYPSTDNEIIRLLRLLDHLGIPRCGEHLELPRLPSDAEALDASPELRASTRGQPFVCVNPGATHATRRWPPERFAAVADALAGAGFPIVLTGAASDRALTAAVRAHMRKPALDTAGTTSLGALFELVRRAALVVTNDTGTSHVAAATGTPSVVVFSTSDSRRWAPLDRDRHRVVHGPVAERVACCGPHRERRCLRDGCVLDESDVDASCADGFASTEAVLREASDVLGLSEPDATA